MVTPMLENMADPLFRENIYGLVTTVSTRTQSRKFHRSCCRKIGAETVLDGETCFSPRDEKRVPTLCDRWFHSDKPLTNGTFEMYWDFTTKTMQGVRSEGNISTKWLWTDLDGALDWVSQIFHTERVPMPKLLPDNFVYDVFIQHTFFDVLDPAFEDQKCSGHRVRSMSLPSTPVVRNNDGELEADLIEPRELEVAVLDQAQERTRRQRGKHGKGRGKFAADKSEQVVGVLVSPGACEDSSFACSNCRKHC